MLNMLTASNNPLTDIGTALQSVTTWIITLFENVVPVFWDGTNGTFTFVGWLSIVLFSLGIVYGVIRFIRSMVRI